MNDERATSMPRARALAIGAALVLCFGALVYVVSPQIGGLKPFALTPKNASHGGQAFQIDRTAIQGPHTLYAPAIGGVATLSIDARDILIAGRPGASGFGMGSQSVLAPLPPQIGTDTASVNVNVSDDHGYIGVSPIYLVPKAVADDAAQSQRNWAWRIQIASLTVSLLASFAILSLFGVALPHLRTGAMAALSYLVMGQALARERDVATFMAHRIDGAEALLAIWVAFALAVMVKVEGGASRFGRAPLVLLGLSSVATVGPAFGLRSSLCLWIAAALAAPLIAVGVARTWVAAKEPSFPPALLASMVIALASAAYGLLRAADPQLFNEAFVLATLHGLGALPLLTFGAIALCVQAFVARRETIAKLKADFAVQSAELGGVRASLQEESRKRLLFEERTRITRDMHDGIGGRLLSLLIRVRGGRLEIGDVEREVQESLDDLRLIVDSLDTAGGPLVEALEAFHARAERQVEGAGLTLNWCEDADALDGVSLDPQATLDVLRILQEATANALRHSDAQTVSISFVRDVNGGLNISISDDGRGIPPAAEGGRGKGLKNMKARAARLGAALTLSSNEGRGCRVSFALPAGQGGYSESGSPSHPSLPAS